MNPDPVADLTASANVVRDGARRAVGFAAYLGGQALHAASPPYPYRYAARLAAGVRTVAPRTIAPDVTGADLKIGGRAKVFSGGGGYSDVVFGAEFGSKGGDYRVSIGRRSYTFTAAEARSRIARARAGTRISVRRGFLRQFPPRRKDGWFLTPALDRLIPQVDDTFERVLIDATGG